MLKDYNELFLIFVRWYMLSCAWRRPWNVSASSARTKPSARWLKQPNMTATLLEHKHSRILLNRHGNYCTLATFLPIISRRTLTYEPLVSCSKIINISIGICAFHLNRSNIYKYISKSLLSILVTHVV